MTFTPWRLEKGDTITLSADKKTLTYKFNNYGRIDGIDFKTACAQRLTILRRDQRPQALAESDLARPATGGIRSRTGSWSSRSRDPDLTRGHHGGGRRRPPPSHVARGPASPQRQPARRPRRRTVLVDERLRVELGASEHEPDRLDRLVADRREAVRDRRVDRDRVARLQDVLVEADPDLEPPAQDVAPLVSRVALERVGGLDAPPTS